MRVIDADKVIEKLTELESEIQLNNYMDKIYRERECLYLDALKKLIDDQETVESGTETIEFTDAEKQLLKIILDSETDRISSMERIGYEFVNYIDGHRVSDMLFRIADKIGIDW